MASNNASENGGDLWALFGVASVWNSNEGKSGTGYRAGYISKNNEFTDDLTSWFNSMLSVGIDGFYAIAPQILTVSTDKGAFDVYSCKTCKFSCSL